MVKDGEDYNITQITNVGLEKLWLNFSKCTNLELLQDLDQFLASDSASDK